MNSDTEFKVASTAPAGMDLLTVLMHKYGHALGLGHSLIDADVMDDTLITGVRRNPGRLDVFSSTALRAFNNPMEELLNQVNSVLN